MKLHHPLVFLLSLQVNAFPSSEAADAKNAIAARLTSSFASDKYTFADSLSNSMSGVESDAKQTKTMEKLKELSYDYLAEHADDQFLDDLERLYADAQKEDDLEKRNKQFLWWGLILAGTVAAVTPPLLISDIKGRKRMDKGAKHAYKD